MTVTRRDGARGRWPLQHRETCSLVWGIAAMRVPKTLPTKRTSVDDARTQVNSLGIRDQGWYTGKQLQIAVEPFLGRLGSTS